MLPLLLACSSPMPASPGKHFLGRGAEGTRTLEIEGARRHGLSLDEARTWSLTLPQDAQLYVPASTPESELVVELDGEELERADLGEPLELDLSRHAGRSGALVLRSEPPGAFLAEPVLATPEEDPQRVVLLFSDHGEEFWEHGRIGHAFQLSEEQLQVPFVLSGPGLEPGRRQDPATLQDIVPTLLDLLQLPPEPGVDGVSLLEAQPADRPLALGDVLFWDSAIGIVQGRWKWRIDGATERLVDLETGQESEPFRTEDFRAAWAQASGRPLVRVWRIAAPGLEAVWKGPVVRVRFSEPLEQVFARPGEPTLVSGTAAIERTWRPLPEGPSTQRVLDAELRRELEALGYIE